MRCPCSWCLLLPSVQSSHAYLKYPSTSTCAENGGHAGIQTDVRFPAVLGKLWLSRKRAFGLQEVPPDDLLSTCLNGVQISVGVFLRGLQNACCNYGIRIKNTRSGYDCLFSLHSFLEYIILVHPPMALSQLWLFSVLFLQNHIRRNRAVFSPQLGWDNKAHVTPRAAE